MTRRLNRTPQKTGTWMILLSPGFLYLAAILGIIVACITAGILLKDPVLISIQGGGV